MCNGELREVYNCSDPQYTLTLNNALVTQLSTLQLMNAFKVFLFSWCTLSAHRARHGT